MQQRRLSRGLALSAVTALGLTGLGTAPAHAAAPAVQMISIVNSGHLVSVKPDDSTYPETGVTLTAAVADPTATVAFEYNTDPSAADDANGWTSISAASPLGGYATTQWTPDPALVGTTVAVRVAATKDASTTYSTRRGVTITGPDSPKEAVELLGLFSSEAGFFTQPYASTGRTRTLASVAGTTSATSGSVALSWWRPSDGTFQGRVNAAVTEEQIKVSIGSPSTYAAGGSFAAALDITAFGPHTDDVLAVAAERDSDDVKPVSLRAQTISTVEVDASSTVGSSTTPVTVTVLDQDNSPIAGAEMRRSSDGGLVGYTDGRGSVVAHQPSGTGESYYANATDDDAYDGATDKVSSPVDVPAYVPVPTTTKAVLTQGVAFDDDEYADGDVALQVVDQEGKPFEGARDVSWALYPTGTTPPAPTMSTTDAHGRLVIPFDPAGPDGSYTLSYTTPSGAPVAQELSSEFVAGQAALALSPTRGSAGSGGTITYTGHLTVSGHAAPGRIVTLTYARGQELAPGLVADAGIVSGGSRTTSATVTTKADGTFTVLVSDPAEAGRPTETGGRLTAKAATVAGAANAEFGKGPGSVRLKLTGTSRGGAADKLVVDAPSSVPGETVRLFRKVGKGGWKAVLTRKLNRRGDVRITVSDTNGPAATRYKVQLVASKRVKSSTSNVRTLP